MRPCIGESVMQIIYRQCHGSKLMNYLFIVHWVNIVFIPGWSQCLSLKDQSPPALSVIPGRETWTTTIIS